MEGFDIVQQGILEPETGTCHARDGTPESPQSQGPKTVAQAVLSSVYRELDESVRMHLAELARFAVNEEDDRRVAELARQEVPKLVSAVRTLLVEHRPDARGHCPTCRPGLFRRRLAAPCRAYLAAHLCLMNIEDMGMKKRTDRLPIAN